MVTCHGGKGGRTLEEKFSDSKMATTSIVHLRQERLTTLHIANLLLLWNFWAFSCNVKKLVLRRQIRRQKKQQQPTPDCFKAVSVQSYEHISMHAVYLRAPPLPICRLCNYDQRQEVPEWNIRTSAPMQIADQDVSTSPGSASPWLEDHNSHPQTLTQMRARFT